MSPKKIVATGLMVVAPLTGALLIGAGPAMARSIFLNGVDVSSSRSQELRNVQIRINEKGDIFISAPHYQVNEEDFFTPLSRVNPQQPTPPPGAPTGPSMAARENPKPAADQPPAWSPAPPVPLSDAPAGQSPGARNDASAAFVGGKAPANPPRAVAPVSPDSMPPVLDATPPATGTRPAGP